MLNKGIVILLVIILAGSSSAVGIYYLNSNEDSYDKTAGSVQITDENNVTVGFDEPVTHIASLGRSITLVLNDFSCTENIVVMDKYSQFSESNISSMEGSKAKIVGTYNSDSTTTAQILIKMVQDGEFDMKTGVVIGYNASYYTAVLDTLDSMGFKVIRYYPESVEQMKEMTLDMGKILWKSEQALQMCQDYDFCLNEVKETLIGLSVEKASVLYVRGTITTPQIGLAGSIADQLITGAYAINAGVEFVEASSGMGIDTSKTTCDLASTSAYFSNVGSSNYKYIIVDGAYKKTGSNTVAEQFQQDMLVSSWKTQLNKESVQYLSMERDWNTFSIVLLTEGIYKLANMLYGEGTDIF